VQKNKKNKKTNRRKSPKGAMDARKLVGLMIWVRWGLQLGMLVVVHYHVMKCQVAVVNAMTC